jgi:uncharacterized iron-regulated membrane protein
MGHAVLMKTLDLLHRWTGGLIGLVLVVLGVTGTILLYRDSFVMLPHAVDRQVQSTEAIISAVETIMADPSGRPASILFAREGFGLNLLTWPDRSGAYADQSGQIVIRWASHWQRPELFLFDLHHHLLAGETGEIVAGVAGLCALFFVISGTILWWRTRATFAWRVLPARMTRPAILRHHRDLGVVMAPLLLLSAFTGVSMIFPVVSAVVIGPATPAVLAQSGKAPEVAPAALAQRPNWRGMIATARQRHPDAEIRLIALPREPGGLITMRMKQPAEWLPNGRTTLWFAPDSGRLVEARDALRLPREAQWYNTLYPLHAAKVGGLTYRLVMTLVGLTLTLLGSLTVWSFWFRRRPVKRMRVSEPVAAE